MASGDREDEMAISCEQVVELLPWYLSRTLGESEAAAVAEHLASCENCPAELEATARMAWITEQHVPVGLLTEYAFGAEIDPRERTVVEGHLAHCDRCQEELRSAQEVAGLRLERGATSEVRAWWPLAVAASLTIVVLAALWWSATTAMTPSPEGNVALVELLPDSFGVRGASETPGLSDGRPVTAVLVTDLVLEGDVYRARLVTRDGEEVWAVSDLRPSHGGTFVLHLPAGLAPPAGSEILLEAQQDGEWRAIERYPISE